MSLADFFSPVAVSKFSPKDGFYASQLGYKIEVYEDVFPDLDQENFDIALIGVLDDRGAVNNQGCALAPDYVREKLYTLSEGSFKSKIID